MVHVYPSEYPNVHSSSKDKYSQAYIYSTTLPTTFLLFISPLPKFVITPVVSGLSKAPTSTCTAVGRMGSDLAYSPFGDYTPSSEASSRTPFVEAATSQVLHYILFSSAPFLVIPVMMSR